MALVTVTDRDILDNENLIYFTLHRYYPAYIHDEDIIQIGRIGLWKALQTHDPSTSKFGNYAVVCIKNEIGHHFSGVNTKMRTPPTLVYIDATPPNTDEANGHDAIIGTTDIDFLDIEAIVAGLTAQQRLVLALLCSGYCVAEIARKLHSTKFLINKEKARIAEAILKEVTTYEEGRRGNPCCGIRNRRRTAG